MSLTKDCNQVIDRLQLEQIFPHRGNALIADCGQICQGICSLILLPSSFSRYTDGHNWYFPMHWLIEMAALAAGLQACYQLKMVYEIDLSHNCLPSFLQPGVWKKRPLTPRLFSIEPIIAQNMIDDWRMTVVSKLIKFIANVELRQGREVATLTNLEAVILLQN